MKAPKVEQYKPPEPTQAEKRAARQEQQRMRAEDAANRQREAAAEAARGQELAQQQADTMATKAEQDRISEQRRRRGSGLGAFITTSQRGITQTAGSLSDLLGV
jgi:hypothetical protein